MTTQRDWIGDSKSVYVTLGASNHTDHDRQSDDYYATEPKTMELLLAEETFSHKIWEPACGEGHLSKVLEAHGYDVLSTDLVYRGYGDHTPTDFLTVRANDFDGDIITNPPYKHALEFAQNALANIKDGHKVAMFLKPTFLESKARKRFFLESPQDHICKLFSSQMRNERRV